METGYNLIDFVVIFAIQSSEFVKKWPNFGSNLRKICITKQNVSNFNLKIDFIDQK